MAKQITSKELYTILGTAIRSSKAGTMNKEAAQNISKIATVIIRNACAELSYAKLQKGKIKLEFFEPQEASKE